MKCVVTGAAGFIGSHLTDCLLSRGDTVIAVDNFTTGRRGNLAHIKSQRFTLVEDDIFESSLDYFSGVDWVFHLAAFVNVSGSLMDPMKCYRDNVAGFGRVLSAAARYPVSKVVYASSSAVYGGDQFPRKESQPVAPDTPYALSKAINEQQAKAALVPTVGLRFFNVYGMRQQVMGAYPSVVPAWFDAVRTRQPALLYGDGSTTRDFVYVKDVAAALVLAAVGPHEGVFNVGSGVETSLQDLFTAICEAELSSVPLVRKESRPGDSPRSCADISAANTFLSWSPCWSLAKGLTELGLHRG